MWSFILAAVALDLVFGEGEVERCGEAEAFLYLFDRLMRRTRDADKRVQYESSALKTVQC